MENLVVHPKFWKGKRVFLTGHTGFKGSWLALWLYRLGADVHGYALPPLNPSLYSQLGLDADLTSALADVRDADAVGDALAAARADIVFHLAAQPLVRASYHLPVDTFDVNVMGTAHILDAARRDPSVRAVVVITTDKVYESGEGRHRETDALGGHDPYSTSKACVELLCQSWRRSYGGSLPWTLATARAGNVIGGGDWADDRLIPDLVRGAGTGTPTLIRNPEYIRPWQHVLDPLAGYLRLAELLWERGDDIAGAWNFGPDASSEVPVREVAELVRAEWGEGCDWVETPGAHPHETSALTLDSTVARSQLGWMPRLRLTEAVRWTVRWYRALMAGESARTLTLNQIETYETLSA